MQSNVASISSPPAQKRYLFYAYSAPIKLSLRNVRKKLGKPVTEVLGERCLVWLRSDAQYIFVFKFGTVVFFNVPFEDHESCLNRLEFDPFMNPKGGTHKASSSDVSNSSTEGEDEEEEEDLSEDQLSVTVEPGQLKVEFNLVTIPDLTLSTIQIIAEVLAQSNALEIIEWEVDAFLKQSELLPLELKKSDWRFGSRRKLLQYLAASLAARYRLINQLAVLDEPEKTWTEEQLYTLYNKLYDNLDLEDRLFRIDKMLELASDSTRLILEVHQSKRFEILEIIIILLIAFELVAPIFK